jgi:DMSO/TMAO reductase YedYZ molybdopterin-dependent catalytic subunit
MTISSEELQLATRNHGMPLEGLRWDVTPVGMHYLLIHYDVPRVDEASWRLEIRGERTLSLSLDDLRLRTDSRLVATMECAGNGRAGLDPRPSSQPWLNEAVGNAEWIGTPLAPLLEEAGLPDGTCEVLFTGLDRGVEGSEPAAEYARSLPLEEAMNEDVILAWGINGQSLPPQHGFPLRLVVPGWYGMTNVKWLGRIEALTEPWTGFQNAVAYRMRTDPEAAGEPLSRIEPRSLMVPPGIPEFMTRRRFVEPGRLVVEGRAWSGWGPVEEVLFGVDGDWSAAALDAPEGRHAWRRWTFEWDATPGDHELSCRASDASGRTQPLKGTWNVGGYANNSVHRVGVTVRAR